MGQASTTVVQDKGGRVIAEGGESLERPNLDGVPGLHSGARYDTLGINMRHVIVHGMIH
jgi:hypothetical protein